MSLSPEVCDVLRDVVKTRPAVGDQCTVTGGTYKIRCKHLGKSGVIRWHGPDKFAGRQYGDPDSHHLTYCMGRHRFRVQIETADGEKFFTKAEYLDIPTKPIRKGGEASALPWGQGTHLVDPNAPSQRRND